MFNSLNNVHCLYYASSSILTTLEALPNELLFEMFRYASVSDLFYSWLNLNERFNGIISCLSIGVFYSIPRRTQCSPWWDAWKDSSDSDMFESLRCFASQIDCLRIDENLSFNVLNQINILDYSNVRILKLCELDTIQCDAIRPENFPHLKHLSLQQTADFSLEVLCQFKSLHSCEFQSLHMKCEYSNLSSDIQSIFLWQCHLSDMPCLLHCFSQMNFLKVCIILSANDFETWKPTVNLVHLNMKSFNVYFVDCSSSPEETTVNKCHYVSQFLTWITFDECIRYRVSLANTRNFNFQQLPHIISQLRFTRLLLRFIWIYKYEPLPNIDCIRQIPLFNQLRMLNNDSKGALFHVIIWNNTSLSTF